VRKGWGWTGLGSATLLCTFHFSSFDVFDQALRTDIRYYLYYAWRLSEGAVPHRDLFEVKTQLAVFVGALFYDLGGWLGIEPLFAIRIGYLGLAATGGLLAYEVHRRLGRGSVVAGWLGVLAYCSFGLIGELASIGNVPKLLMAVLASATGLLVARGRWFWAGAAGALAFLDWQVGALAWLGAFASALILGEPRRRAARLVAAGAAAALTPFAVYFAAHGALAETVRQILLESFLRGTDAGSAGMSARLLRLVLCVETACRGQTWLFYASALGIPVAVRWLWRRRDTPEWRLLLPLFLYHVGVVGFSLLDFQWYGDLLALLHSAAFFLAVGSIALFGVVSRWRLERLPASGGEASAPRARAAVAMAFLAAAVVAARPAGLRPQLLLWPPSLEDPMIHPRATLADQLLVAEQVRRVVGERSLALLDASELLFLLRRVNLLPVVYYNRAVWRAFRASPAEPERQTAVRMLREVGPGAFVLPVRYKAPRELSHGFRRERFVSPNGRYSVFVWVETHEQRPAGLP
jgi:PAS domain-containing protein